MIALTDSSEQGSEATERSRCQIIQGHDKELELYSQSWETKGRIYVGWLYRAGYIIFVL